MTDIYARGILCEKISLYACFFARIAEFCAFLFILAMAIFCKFAIIKSKKTIRYCNQTYKTAKGSEKVYTAMNIASEIVRQYKDHGKAITNLKLQKILYYVQMRSLQENGCALFEEDFQAWRHGPVVPEIYEAFRKYVSGDIDYEDPVLKQSTVEIKPDQKNLITSIVAPTLDVDAWDMVYKTHNTKPWKDCYIPNANCIISKDRIRRDGEVNLS